MAEISNLTILTYQRHKLITKLLTLTIFYTTYANNYNSAKHGRPYPSVFQTVRSVWTAFDNYFFFFLQYIVFYNLIPLFTLQCKECSNQQSACPVYLYRYKKLPAYFNVFTIVAFVINYYALAIAPAIYLHVVSPLKVYYNNAWYYKYKMGVGNVIKFHIHIQINLSLPENWL